MAKILFGILALLILIFIVIAMYCAFIVAGCSDDDDNEDSCEGDNDEMFLKRQICTRCKTGRCTYELDTKSEMCPYIGCWRKNKCHFYKPLEKETPKRFFSGLKNK